MKFNIITLFPDMFSSPFNESIIKRAIKNNIVEIKTHNLRDWAIDDYGTVDDRPFGGDVGMLIRPEPVYNAMQTLRPLDTSLDREALKTRIIMMSARGKRFTQEKAEELSKYDNLILLCGHYEGFDQRVSDFMIDEEISIGDYVLTGGEIAAMVVIDAIARLKEGVLGKDNSSHVESFSEIEIDNKKIRTIEYPQYTRPRDFMGHGVPEVLVSGDPKKIKDWQKQKIIESLEKSTSSN